MNAVRSDQLFNKQNNGGKKDCPVIPRPANFRLRNEASFGENWLRSANPGPSSLSAVKAYVVSGISGTLFNSTRSRNALTSAASTCSTSRSEPQSSSSRQSVASRNHTPSKSPRTPNSIVSSVHETKCIVALTEGRGKARGEVGIAAIDLYRPNLIVSQISDCQTYRKTLTKISILSPVEILLPNTFCDGSSSTKLFNCVKDQYPNIPITTVQRRHFSDVQGLELIRKLCVPELSSVEILVQNRFYALSAASALLKYIEFLQNVIFAPKSLSIQYQGSQHTTLIDIETAKRLELVCSTKPATNLKQSSLLGILNHTYTVGGYRLLRATILQPPCFLAEIQQRQECVEELVNNPTLFRAFQCILPKFADAERLLALSMMFPTSADKSEKCIEYQLNYALLLKSSLEHLPVLRDALSNAEHPFFQSLLAKIQAKALEKIHDCVKKLLHDDAKSVKGYSASCIQRCFAIKSEMHVLLDLARKTYCELVDEITQLVQGYAEEFGLPLKIGHNTMKGFHIQMTVAGARNQLRNTELPNVFIQVNKTRSTFTMTTQAVINLDGRCKEMLKEIQSMSAVVLSELLAEVRQHAGCLYQMCESISQIDVICALTALSSLPGFVKPSFGDKIAVKAGKHPILNHISQMEPVPNDIDASEGKNFHIVTGPNMAGKSIYIRQVALLQIMAQTGCFIPAESAQFRITDHIFSRIGFEDSIEGNASTFVVEMREMNFILQQMTPTSLIIIDELCRGTSSEEGTSIAWALCEHLLRSPAFTFFTTHFLYLTRLQNIYSNVNNLCLEAIEKSPTNRGDGANAEDGEEKWIRYTHKIIPGVMKMERYGLRLAKLSRMPKEVTEAADVILNKLAAVRKPLPNMENGEQATMMYQTFRCMLKAIAEKYVDDSASAVSRNVMLTKKFKDQHPNWREELLMPGTPLPTPKHLRTESARKRFVSSMIRQLQNEQVASEIERMQRATVAVQETPVCEVQRPPLICFETPRALVTPQSVPGSQETPRGILKNKTPVVQETPIQEIQRPSPQCFETPRTPGASQSTQGSQDAPRSATKSAPAVNYCTPIIQVAPRPTFKTPTKLQTPVYSPSKSSTPLSVTPSKSDSASSTSAKSITPLKMKMRRIEEYFKRVQRIETGSLGVNASKSLADAACNSTTYPEVEKSNPENEKPEEAIQPVVSSVEGERNIEEDVQAEEPVQEETTNAQQETIEVPVPVNPEPIVIDEEPEIIQLQTPPPEKVTESVAEKSPNNIEDLLKNAMKRINFETPVKQANSSVTSFSFGAASFTMPGAFEMVTLDQQPEIEAVAPAPISMDVDVAKENSQNTVESTPVTGHRFDLQATPEFRCSISFKEFMEQKARQRKYQGNSFQYHWERSSRSSSASNSQLVKSPSMQKFLKEFSPSTPQVREAQRALEEKLERMRNGDMDETPSSSKRKRLFGETLNLSQNSGVGATPGGMSICSHSESLADLIPSEESPVITANKSSSWSQQNFVKAVVSQQEVRN